MLSSLLTHLTTSIWREKKTDQHRNRRETGKMYWKHVGIDGVMRTWHLIVYQKVRHSQFCRLERVGFTVVTDIFSMYSGLANKSIFSLYSGTWYIFKFSEGNCPPCSCLRNQANGSCTMFKLQFPKFFQGPLHPSMPKKETALNHLKKVTMGQTYRLHQSLHSSSMTGIITTRRHGNAVYLCAQKKRKWI